MAINTEKPRHRIPSGRKMNGWLALSPLLVFLLVYLVSSLVAHDFYKVPVAAAFMIASAYAMLITRSVETLHFGDGHAEGLRLPGRIVRHFDNRDFSAFPEVVGIGTVEQDADLEVALAAGGQEEVEDGAVALAGAVERLHALA